MCEEVAGQQLDGCGEERWRNEERGEKEIGARTSEGISRRG